MANYKGEDRLEKHYTPEYLIDEMLSLVNRFYGFNNTTQFLETSAGDGAILEKLNIPYIAYDILNETNRYDIKQCDYLKEKILYKKGRVAIQNPPFAKGLKFVYKSLEECDYYVALLSQNSLMNIDYEKYYADEIQLWRNIDFGSCKVSICIVAIRKKKEGDTYD